MNAKQKLHQVNLSRWAALIKEQTDSGLTIKEWCLREDISIHQYYYWKHLLKESFVDSAIHDLVAIDSTVTLISDITEESDCDTMSFHDSQISSPDSHNLHNLPDSLSIQGNGVRIELSESASDQLIIDLIKVVRHA